MDEALWVWELATWVPVKAKKRKRKVPMNSPKKAMVWFRTVLPGSLRLRRKGFEGLEEEDWMFWRKPRLEAILDFVASMMVIGMVMVRL